MDATVCIRRAGRDDLPAAARLLAASLGFDAADAVPAWLMRTTDECGGITLVAVARSKVIGASYAITARTGFLYSCGLAVQPSHRGQRVGLELKLAQRREAIALGYSEVRWTTDPVNARALRVYLSGLGARVCGYQPGLHDGLRADPGHAQDDLELVWHLDGAPVLDTSAVRAVELPWTPSGHARVRVRDEMTELLAAGYVGYRLELDRDARRSRMLLARAAA